MSVDALRITSLVFVQIWKLFTNWHIPGTNVTPAAWALFFFCAHCALRFAKRTLQTGDAGGESE